MSNVDPEVLSALVDGDLSDAEAEALKATIAEDRSLSHQVQELHALKRTAREVRPHGPSRDLWPAIRTALEEEGTLQPSGFRVLWKPGFALAFGMSVVLGVFALRPDPGAEARAQAKQAFQADIVAARIAYLRAIQKLAAAAKEDTKRLPPLAKKQLESSLATVDRAILECEEALTQAPNDPFGHETLIALYDEKIQLLQAALTAADRARIRKGGRE